MLRNIQSDFYGDNSRWWIGIIEDIADPMKLGRARVRIFGIHNPRVDEVPTADLPWAQPIIPTTEGGISGIGSNPLLLEGSQVVGMFLDGKQSQIPVIFGALPHIELSRSSEIGSTVNEANSSIPEVSHNQQNSDNRPGTSTRASHIDTSGAVGSNNVEKAFNFFISTNLFSPEQSAGICGNLMQESKVNPIEINKTEGSQGIAQWNPSDKAGNRLGALKDFSKERNLDFASLETQLQFIVYELETKSYYGMAQLQASSDIVGATRIFSAKYERPNKRYERLNQRVQYAFDVYEQYYQGS